MKTLILPCYDPDCPLYNPPFTIREAVKCGHIWALARADGGRTQDLSRTHKENDIPAYCQAMSQVLQDMLDLAKSDPGWGVPYVHAAHARRVVLQAAYWQNMRNLGDPALDLSRLMAVDLVEVFYKFTYLTVGERESFGDMALMEFLGFPGLISWWTQLVERELV